MNENDEVHRYITYSKHNYIHMKIRRLNFDFMPTLRSKTSIGKRKRKGIQKND